MGDKRLLPCPDGLIKPGFTFKRSDLIHTKGKVENERFLSIALHQGAARKSKVTVTMETLDKIPQRDPTILTVAYKRHRIYLLSKREPQASQEPQAILNYNCVDTSSLYDNRELLWLSESYADACGFPCVLQEAEDATMGRDVFNEKPALEDILAADNGR